MGAQIYSFPGLRGEGDVLSMGEFARRLEGYSGMLGLSEMGEMDCWMPERIAYEDQAPVRLAFDRYKPSLHAFVEAAIESPVRSVPPKGDGSALERIAYGVAQRQMVVQYRFHGGRYALFVGCERYFEDVNREIAANLEDVNNIVKPITRRLIALQGSSHPLIRALDQISA